MTRALYVFALVLIMGLTLRFLPEANWVWWVDVVWITWVALWAAVVAKAPRR